MLQQATPLATHRATACLARHRAHRGPAKRLSEQPDNDSALTRLSTEVAVPGVGRDGHRQELHGDSRDAHARDAKTPVRRSDHSALERSKRSLQLASVEATLGRPKPLLHSRTSDNMSDPTSSFNRTSAERTPTQREQPLL